MTLTPGYVEDVSQPVAESNFRLTEPYNALRKTSTFTRFDFHDNGDHGTINARRVTGPVNRVESQVKDRIT